MANYKSFPVITEGFLIALKESFPDALPKRKADGEPHLPHEIAYLHGQQSVVEEMERVFKRQSKDKSKDMKG